MSSLRLTCVDDMSGRHLRSLSSPERHIYSDQSPSSLQAQMVMNRIVSTSSENDARMPGLRRTTHHVSLSSSPALSTTAVPETGLFIRPKWHGRLRERGGCLPCLGKP